MRAFAGAFGAVSMIALALAGAGVAWPAPAAAQMPVLDTSNYAQNLIQAARSLEQINNQVKSLQNEAAMLAGMRLNLKTVDFPQLQRIAGALQQIDRLMDQAKGLQFKVQGLDQQIDRLFPGSAADWGASDQRVARARAELDAATAAYRQAMGVQAQVVQNVQQDAGTLAELAATSQGAAGALQVAQAANQLLALSVKQQLQLQNLTASEFREAALDRARRAQAEEDGRARTRRFLDGAAAPRN